MKPSPASNYDKLIQELNLMSDSSDMERHKFRLAQIKYEADNRKQKDPEGAYILLGIISCLMGDIEKMHKYHKNAINCSGRSLHSIIQYSSSLFNQGLLEDCYVYCTKAHEIDQCDIITLKLMLKVSFFLQLEDSYKRCKRKLEKLGASFDDPATFLEDDNEWLEKALTKTDQIIKDHPDMLVVPDAKREALVDELIEGVITD